MRGGASQTSAGAPGDDRPVSPDAHYGEATPGKIGMWIFLLSDANMFAGLLLAYGVLRAGSEVWRPPDQPELGINFTAGLTFLLICSSVTMVLAHAAMADGDRRPRAPCRTPRRTPSCRESRAR